MANRRIYPPGRNRPKKESYYEEDPTPRGSVTPVSKQFPEQPGDVEDRESSQPIRRKSDGRSFFVDEDEIGSLHPERGSGDAGDSDDDEPDMPEG
jgi:hypothetical protein